jgi:hypothetical protein
MSVKGIWVATVQYRLDEDFKPYDLTTWHHNGELGDIFLTAIGPKANRYWTKGQWCTSLLSDKLHEPTGSSYSTSRAWRQRADGTDAAQISLSGHA